MRPQFLVLTALAASVMAMPPTENVKAAASIDSAAEHVHAVRDVEGSKKGKSDDSELTSTLSEVVSLLSGLLDG
ncbi:hypothetical protein ASPZODRAFT_19693 [Penicilliopsis zonata CBS 506.65]|uniref:RxLR effector protein n=1 Tax=Penicilliopsis zonata CBS 506.65 TaxID=1073090 RepID=A0A1L9S827_9EURO|nr:hypothetical protein ASPZODRAFT_19693 [Penicilliopsis zonata CBS 506.65]OJJ43290.1 hypothetical protein ASPZODRAFT_19693 [Penicilliopsis zonata CBS 506.65]